MAGLASIPRGFEKQRMVEQGWLPVVWLMTLPATQFRIAMNLVHRSGMTSFAAIPYPWTQQRMGKSLVIGLREVRSLMAGMAGHAVLFV